MTELEKAARMALEDAVDAIEAMLPSNDDENHDGHDARDVRKWRALVPKLKTLTQALAMEGREGAVRVCPEKDSVCGDRPGEWCRTCPKRPAPQHATPERKGEPATPYGEGGGSMAEAWRRGYRGERCIAHAGSDYHRAWREGHAARKTATPEPTCMHPSWSVDANGKCEVCGEADEQDDNLLHLLAECREVASRLAPGVAEGFLFQAIGGPSEVPAYIEAVITSLKATTERKGEPVAWIHKWSGASNMIGKSLHWSPESPHGDQMEVIPLYTSPQVPEDHPLMVFAIECEMGALQEHEVPLRARKALDAARKGE